MKNFCILFFLLLFLSMTTLVWSDYDIKKIPEGKIYFKWIESGRHHGTIMSWFQGALTGIHFFNRVVFKEILFLEEDYEGSGFIALTSNQGSGFIPYYLNLAKTGKIIFYPLFTQESDDPLYWKIKEEPESVKLVARVDFYFPLYRKKVFSFYRYFKFSLKGGAHIDELTVNPQTEEEALASLLYLFRQHDWHGCVKRCRVMRSSFSKEFFLSNSYFYHLFATSLFLTLDFQNAIEQIDNYLLHPGLTNPVVLKDSQKQRYLLTHFKDSELKSLVSLRVKRFAGQSIAAELETLYRRDLRKFSVENLILLSDDDVRTRDREDYINWFRTLNDFMGGRHQQSR